MGDDDIICLSSDDESTTEKLPPKKSNVISEPPLKTESELPVHHNRDLKRKIPQKTGTNCPKKAKIVSNGAIEDISIVSPEQGTDGESRSKPKNDETQQRANMSNLKSCKSSHHSMTRDFDSIKSSRNPNPKIQDIPRKSLISGDTYVSSNHNKISSRIGSNSTALSDSRPEMENIANGVRNIYAKRSQLNHSKSSSSRTLQIGEKRKSDSPEIPSSIGQRIETRKAGPSNTQIDPGASKIVAESGNVRSSLLSVKSVHRIKIAKNSATINERRLNEGSDCLPKINDSSPNHGNFSSPVSTVFPNERKNERTTTPKSDSSKISKRTSCSSTSKDRRSSSRSSKSSDVEIIVATDKTPKALSSRIELNEAGKKSSKTTNDPSIREISPVAEISRKNETRKSSHSKTPNDKAPDRIINGVSPKSAENRKSLKNIKTEKALSSKSTSEKNPNMAERMFSKSTDIHTTPKRSKLPEVEIFHTIETLKSSKRPASDNVASRLEKFVPKSNNRESSRESSQKSNAKISKISETSESGSSRSTPGKPSKHDENNARTSNSNSESRESSREKILHKKDDPTVDRTKIDGNRKGKSIADRLKSRSPTSEISRRRITPQKISELNNPSIKFDESTSNVSDVQHDAQKSSRSKDQPKSKNFEPTPGCSKTPDAKFPITMEKTRTTSSPEIVLIEELSNRDNGQEVKKSAEGLGNDEPQAGCSKSLDKQDHFEKPHLIVKAKKPVDQPEQDTFAMFLGLCLQTDRTIAMEKVVAKLKRLYEGMNPEYAKSRAFMNFLDEKRDKIITRGKVYYWISQVVEEMKLRKQRGTSSKSKEDDGKKEEAKENDEDKSKASNEENEEDEEDSEKSQRLRRKIRTIEKAMKQCSKRIRELEIAEVDFDDENNSYFMKLDRYKEKMVELYTKMCEYTNEHADAGRAYLRPKHLRFTQIPSIDQAINSFINSKLSNNRKKGMKGKSFVDGLIFPDYIDILECVGKVNETQKLGLTKRKQQQLAEEAFTKLGKYLQEARQKDYWDTFSLDLENSEDPATSDLTLSEKLIQNQEIAEKKTKEIFEEYVRKQDERNTGNDEITSSEADHDDDEDDNVDDDDEEDDNNDEKDVKKSSRAIESDIELSKDDENDARNEKNGEAIGRDSESDDDHSSKTDEKDDDRKNKKDVEDGDCRDKKYDEENSPNILETITEVPSQKSPLNAKADNEVPEVVNEEDKIQENNNVIKTMLDVQLNSSERESTQNPIHDEVLEIEVNLAEVDSDDVIKAAVTKTMQEPPPSPPQPPLRIRSFAKPPSSWLSSQEVVDIPSDPETSNNTETIDVTDDEPSVETSAKTEEFAPISTPRNFTNERDLVSDTRQILIRPNNVQNSITESSSRLIGSIPSNSSSSMENTVNQPSIVARSSIKLPMNQQSTNLINVPNKNSSSFAQINSQTSQGSKVPQKIRISTSATNPVNVRLQVIPTKGPQQIQVEMTNGTRPVSTTKQMQVVRLPNGNCLARASNSQISGNSLLPTRSSIATNQMKVRMPKVVQSSTNISQQVRPRISTVGNGRIINSSQAQIIRFSNGQSIRAMSATFRPLQTSGTQQRPSLNIAATSMNTKNLQNAPITINNPRFIKIPAAAVARSPEMSQLRIERIENSPQQCPRLSNNEISSGETLPQIVSTGQCITPVLKPRMNENVPTTEQHKSEKRPDEKTWWMPPDAEPPRKK